MNVTTFHFFLFFTILCDKERQRYKNAVRSAARQCAIMFLWSDFYDTRYSVSPHDEPLWEYRDEPEGQPQKFQWGRVLEAFWWWFRIENAILREILSNLRAKANSLPLWKKRCLWDDQCVQKTVLTFTSANSMSVLNQSTFQQKMHIPKSVP